MWMVHQSGQGQKHAFLCLLEAVGHLYSGPSWGVSPVVGTRLLALGSYLPEAGEVGRGVELLFSSVRKILFSLTKLQPVFQHFMRSRWL